MEYQPDSMDWGDAYRLLIGGVQPRPIAWVSTLDPNGIANLAPFSFFMGVCPRPFTLAFAPMRRGDAEPTDCKDTLRNLEATRECVVNVVPEALAVQMNATSGEYAADVDEFAIAGLTAAPSASVKPPRVAESPINFECTVTQIVTLSEEAGGASLVILRAQHIHVADAVLDGHRIALDRIRPIGRLAG
ncbi:MAG: flavin reductase family protein, partial [Vulcanimicrobiaceae bacterium]